MSGQDGKVYSLPRGYVIVAELGAFTLKRGGKIVRCSATREALVDWLIGQDSAPTCAECGGPIYQDGYRTCARCSSAACVGQRPAVWPRYETDQPLALFAAPDPLGTLDMFGEQS